MSKAILNSWHPPAATNLHNLFGDKWQIHFGVDSAEGFVPCEEAAKKKADCVARIECYYNQKYGIYERLILGEMDTEAYRAEKTASEVELDRLERVYTAMQEQTEQQVSNTRAVEIARTAKQTDSLTPELVHLLIEKVLLYPGGHLEVY